MIAYITGSSSGIGKALAELLLENNHKVIGLSRTNTISHVNYKHVFIDLSEPEIVAKFVLGAIKMIMWYWSIMPV